MTSSHIKIATAAALAVIAFTALAVVAFGGGTDEDVADAVTIVQNDGTEVRVAVPVERICIVNTNAAEFATVLGVSDRVVGVSEAMRKTPTEAWWAELESIGTYSEPSADAILKTGSRVVVGQCTSMPITNVEALKAQGITVILLDLYGFGTQTDDLKQFARLFPDSDAEKAAQEYTEFFDGVVSSLREKTSGLKDAEKKTFIATMGTKASSKYYTGSAELSGMLCDVCGMRNSIADMLPDTKKSTSVVGEDKIDEYYERNGIDLFVLRNTSTYDAARADIESFMGSHAVLRGSGMFDEMTVVKTVDSKVLSGPRCFVGMVYFVGLAYPQLDIGMTVDGVVSDYNSRFGTDWPSDGLFYEYGS